MRRLFVALAACSALLSMGAAAGPPKWLVDHVRDEINDGVRDPDATDSPPLRQPSARMFKRVDINGDQIADWQVDFQNEPGWCGSGGCRMELWLGRTGGGLTPVWDAQVREFRLKPGKEGATIDVDFHGSACDQAGVAPCLRRYVWDISEVAFLPAPNKRGDGVLAGLPIPPLELTLVNAPAEVGTEARAMAALCRAAGGHMDDDDMAVTRLPDLNGDGVRDWAIGSQYGDCEGPSDASGAPFDLEVMVSAPDGHFNLAWGAKAPNIAFDISRSPAAMLQLSDTNACMLQSAKQCPAKAFQWNPATRRLEPGS